MRQDIVVLGGLGDVYLMMALYAAFVQAHPGNEIVLVIKSKHRAVAGLFPGVRIQVDDKITYSMEGDQDRQRNYLNDLWTGAPFYAHPCMKRTRLTIDELPSKLRVSQADLFRMVLGLPLSAPLTRAAAPHCAYRANTVMIVDAVTWPNTQPGFYPKLVDALRRSGREVWINVDAPPRVPLSEVFTRAAETEWVIGPQCGLMSILITGGFPCRKTLATPSIDDGTAPAYWARQTFPYAYSTAFAGVDADIEEYKVGSNHDGVIKLILEGANARRLWPHDPAPTKSVTLPLTPGDFFDRFAVLTVKREKFSPDQRAAIEREYQRHDEARRQWLWPQAVDPLLDQLIELHARNFDLLAELVPQAIENKGVDVDWSDTASMIEAHFEAMRSNRDRVRLKQEIDRLCHAPYFETKSYYGPTPPR
jgi:hypothetical protein